MLEKGGSDLHLTVGLPPKTRASNALQAFDDFVCLQTLRAAKADRANRKKGRPFVEFARERGYLK